jgi:hypothetical protein
VPPPPRLLEPLSEGAGDAEPVRLSEALALAQGVPVREPAAPEGVAPPAGGVRLGSGEALAEGEEEEDGVPHADAPHALRLGAPPEALSEGVLLPDALARREALGVEVAEGLEVARATEGEPLAHEVGEREGPGVAESVAVGALLWPPAAAASRSRSAARSGAAREREWVIENGGN